MTQTDHASLIRAIGGAFGIIGALMERADVATLDEFASALAIYGAATNETDADEGAIIAQWVLALHEQAAGRSDSN